MKKTLFYLSVIVVSALLLTSCASRKYGCPNSTGMKVESKATRIPA
jgi:hypothetical protein